MKKFFNNLGNGVLITIFGLIVIIFPITALITHIWTVVIAFKEGGFISGAISFFFPVISEIYWMFKMFGVNNLYAYIALAHLILALPYSLFSNRS